MSFSPLRAGASIEYLTFDFARLMPTGTTITSAVWNVTREAGTADASPGAMKSGSPVISGSRVSQLVQPTIAETQYCMECVASLSDGQSIPLADTVWVVADLCG